MPRNSQGTFTNIYNWVQDDQNNLGIVSSRHQEGDDDQAQGLTDSLDRLGRGGMQADLAMGNNKIVQVNQGTEPSDAAPISQLQTNTYSIGAAETGAANAYVTALTPAITAYTTGLRVTFYATNANTGASTLQVNGVVPAPALQFQQKDLAPGFISDNQLIDCEFDGVSFQILNAPAVLPSANGGTGTTVDLGTAAFKNVGTAAGDLVELNAERIFPEEQQGMIGEIRMWAPSGAPATWLICDGSAVSRTTYVTLFNKIGTTYGVGDGSTTFNLPDFRARVGAGVGAVDGTGTPRALADKFGEEKHTLTIQEMPAHDHQQGSGDNNITAPWGTEGTQPNRYQTAPQAGTNEWLTNTRGGGQGHNNCQPTLTVNFIIKAGYAA